MTRTLEPAFNLLDEPWIPIRRLNGECCDVSLTEALIGADTIANLTETSPINLVALHRLLLAILHRALTTNHGQWKEKDRTRWYREGLPEEAIRAYLDQWRERFWLFHPEYPFMQVAALADAAETQDKLKPWTQICLESATGNTPIVFDHALDDSPSQISPALACRKLLGALQFMPSGLVKVLRDSDKAGPLANTAAVIPIGGTLSETLLLGLHQPSAQEIDDQPSWEQSQPSIDALRSSPRPTTGPNDRYTRLTRAVLLLPHGTQGQIRHLIFAAGLALEEDPNAPDSMTCHRATKDGKMTRVSFAEGRAFWRELPTLVPDVSGKFSHPAAILLWATNLYEQLGRFDIPVSVLVAGLASDQAKLLRWRIDRFNLPLPLLAKPEAAAELRAQIQNVEEVFRRLRGICAEMITEVIPNPNHKDTRARARLMFDHGPTAPVFFSTAEKGLPKLMQFIAAGEIDHAYQHWLKTLKRAAHQAWQATCETLGDSPHALRAEARAYSHFRRLLRSLELPNTALNLEEATV